MIKRLVPALAALATVIAAAAATDTSSLSAFVASCSSDAKGCHLMTLNAVISARGANYGCIPKDVSNDAAADKLLVWLKDSAYPNPKYAKDALPDLMWTGIDEVWPCKK